MGVPTPSLTAGGIGRKASTTNTAPRNLTGTELTQRAELTKYPNRRVRELNPNSTAGKSGPIASGSDAASRSYGNQSKLGQTEKSARQLTESQSTQVNGAKGGNQADIPQAASTNPGANLSLTDSPIPNPLRSNTSDSPRSAAGNSMNRTGRNPQRSAVQTVGYQEEIPIIAGEQIPKNPENITRLAMLEEPASAEPTPASVLESGEGAPTVDPEITETVPGETEETHQQLQWDENDPQQEVPIVQPPVIPAAGNSANLISPAATAQGHYQQGTAVYGQVLNEPQQTASQRAIQLLDENQRLREEMKSKLKELENAQAKLKQQDELWARARQEFLEVRGVVDKLTRENSLLKMQIEKLEGEKVELARQYQSLMQTVEQTLDDLLLKAITQPPQGNPPETTPATAPANPPVAAPVTQPPVAPPIVNGQQASALLKSPQ